jgi:DNA-binding MurR/RpiR family transcriptional regulator
VARLHEIAARGSRADRKLGAAVLADPGFATQATIACLAERAEVSEPTISRFCRTLGCEGLRDFKLRLAQALAVTGRYLAPAPAAGDQVPALISARACAAIETVCRAVDGASLERAAEILAGAAMVRAYGSGGSSSLAAAELENRLFRLGLPACAHSDGEMQQMTAAAADAGTVIVAYSVSGEIRAMINAVEVAGSYGAATIAITAPGSPLAQAAGLVLPFRIEEDPDILRPSPVRYALLALTDMLAAVVARRLGRAAVERMRRIKHHQGQWKSNASSLPLGD